MGYVINCTTSAALVAIPADSGSIYKYVIALNFRSINTNLTVEWYTLKLSLF